MALLPPMEPGPLLWQTLGYTGATNANYITNNNQLTNGATYITNSGGTEAATGSTVVKRDSSADINVRLVRSNYTNQTTISGAMAFRVNNGSDNYTRFCSDGAAIRTFIGAGTSSFSGAYGSLSGRHNHTIRKLCNRLDYRSRFYEYSCR